MAITRIGNPAIADQRGINFRNIIINGGMDLAQRGTSATGLGNGDTGYHTCDRWKWTEGGSPTYEFTMSQETDVPTGQGFSNSLKYDCTVADTSLASSDLLRLQQGIEGQNLQYLKKGTSNAESVTLSFWVKSNKTGTYIAELEDRDNSRYVSQSYTISSANTWEKKTVTFPADTSGAFDNDNAESLRLNFWLGAGSDFTSGTLSTTWHTTNANRAVGQVNLADSTSNEWYITGVQLEAGQVASDFEFLPYDVNAQRCLRYYEGGDNNAPNPFGNCSRMCEVLADGNQERLKIFGVNYLVTKRAIPTLTLYANTGYTTSNRISRYDSASSTETVTAVSTQTANHLGRFITVSSTASTTRTFDFFYEADAEL